MKRFFSVLLIAILLVTSLATAAMAAEPGGTVNVSVTVSGEFSSFLVSIAADPGLTIKNISGAGAFTINGSTAKANWAGAGNVNKVTLTVTVEVAADIAPGTYYISASAQKAAKAVPMEEDTDGYPDGLIDTTVSVSGGSITIECKHQWGEWNVTKAATCTEAGEQTRTCSLCGETQTEAIPAAGHKWETTWSQNAEKHWHDCSVCDATNDEGPHKYSDVVDYKEPTEDEPGYRILKCICGRRKTEEVPFNGEGNWGDIRPMMLLGFSAVLFTLAAGVYVFKRKVNV